MQVNTETGEIISTPVQFDGTSDFDAEQADLIHTAHLDLIEVPETLLQFLYGYGLTETAEEDEDVDPKLAKLVASVRQLLTAVEEFTPLAKDFVEDLLPPSRRDARRTSIMDTPTSLGGIDDVYYDDDLWSGWGGGYDDGGPYTPSARSAAFDEWDEGYVYQGQPMALDDSIGEPEEHDFEAANKAILAELNKNSEETREERENALKEIMGGMSGGLSL